MSTTTAPAPTVEVGDYFADSWGYDQTQVDFYRVVGLTPSGKSVRVQRWSKVTSPDSANVHDTVVPGDSPATVRQAKPGMEDQARSGDYWERQDAIETVDAPVETRRLTPGWSKPAFRVTSFSVATLWDGEPMYQTGAHYGR